MASLANNNNKECTCGACTTHNPLGDQAATAALYATRPNQNTTDYAKEYLDADSKLSSAGAAASLKYATPKDLPSFPTSGVKDDSAAGVAATLGWKNQSTFEHWKPDPSQNASKAAQMAKDYKAQPVWQPEQSSSGAKAAVLAARDSTKVEIWKPEASNWGNSAATEAFKRQSTGAPIPPIDYGRTAVGRNGSMLAATGAMSGRRKRSDSTPVQTNTYPDEGNAERNARSAAAHANKNPSRKSRTGYNAEAGSVPYTNLPREFFTSNPPVELEKSEKDREAVLRASAVAMAQQMYKVQQQQMDQVTKARLGDGHHAANSAHRRRRSNSASSDEVVPMKLDNIQEAAHKLAQERLAKLHDEHAKNREYRDYYGGAPPPKSRLSIRGMGRRQASSDGELDDDAEQSKKIRAQMSLFSTNLSQVDKKKREVDRAALMAAAQRNVTKSLHGMDEKVFAQTGKASQAMMSEWELKAHAAAQKQSDTRMENYGKINIGGGKFIDQADVDAVARRNVQPVLDEIDQKVEAERARQAELKAEEERIKAAVEERKLRAAENAAINKKLRDQEKQEERARKDEAKKAAKEEKRKSKEASEEEKRKAKAAIEEEKRKAKEAADEEKRKAKEAADEEKRKAMEASAEKKAALAETPQSPTDVPVAEEFHDAQETNVPTTPQPAGYVAPTGLRTSMEMEQQERLEEITHPNDGVETTPGKGVRGWLRNRFSRSSSKPQKPDLKDFGPSDVHPKDSEITSTPVPISSPIFNTTEMSGARSKTPERDISPHGEKAVVAAPAALEKAEEAGEEARKDVGGEAGAETKEEEALQHTHQEHDHSPPISPVSSVDHDDEEDEQPQLHSAVPITITSLSAAPHDNASSSATAGATATKRLSAASHDEFEEARDGFEEDAVVTPAAAAAVPLPAPTKEEEAAVAGHDYAQEYLHEHKSASPVRDSKFHEEM